MALNITSLKAKKTEIVRKTTRRARDLGPNPWLDKTWEFNLQSSYDNGEAYELDLPGKWVDAVVGKGKDKGAKTTRLQGDAADAVTLIRDAAEKLNLGAAVDTMPAKRNGYVTVKWQGQKRKVHKPKLATAPTAPAVAPPTAPEGADKPAETA